MKKIYLLLILLFIPIVYAYDYNVSKNVTFMVNPTNIIVLNPDGSFNTYNSTEYTTHTIPFNFTFNVAEPNSTIIDSCNFTNLTHYMNDMRDGIIMNLSNICGNSTTNLIIPTALESSINSSISNSISSNINSATSGMKDDIVTRVGNFVTQKCDYTTYSTFVSQYISTSLLPNITAYNNLESQLSSCTVDRQLCGASISAKDKDMQSLDNDNNTKTYIIFGLVGVILFLLFMQFGEPGMDLLRKVRWKRTDTIALPNASFNKDNTNIIKNGSDLLNEAK